MKRISYPSRSDYDTYEEYEDACESYEVAESSYIDECVEYHYEREYGI